MRVIVADDSRVMRQIVIRTLRQAGYEDWDILEATDGQELYDMTLDNNPDLVLSDWNMPNATGLEALIALRQAGNQVPFGFVTSEGPRRCGHKLIRLVRFFSLLSRLPQKHSRKR